MNFWNPQPVEGSSELSATLPAPLPNPPPFTPVSLVGTAQILFLLGLDSGMAGCAHSPAHTQLLRPES